MVAVVVVVLLLPVRTSTQQYATECKFPTNRRRDRGEFAPDKVDLGDFDDTASECVEVLPFFAATMTTMTLALLAHTSQKLVWFI